MVRYPITVKRSSYRGNSPKGLQKAAKYNRDAAILEKHINDQIKDGLPGLFLYAEIACDVGLSVKRVNKILYSVDCGDTGLIVETDSAVRKER